MSTPHAIDRTACRRFLGLMAAFRKIPKAKGNGWNFHENHKRTSNG